MLSGAYGLQNKKVRDLILCSRTFLPCRALFLREVSVGSVPSSSFCCETEADSRYTPETHALHSNVEMGTHAHPKRDWRCPHHSVLFAVAAVFLLAGAMLAPAEASDNELLHAFGSPGVPFITVDHNDEAQAMVVHSIDNNFVFAGVHNYYDGFGVTDFGLVKTDTVGLFLWAKSYGIAGVEDKALSLIEYSDQGFVLCGHSDASFSVPFASYDYMLVKTDSEGVEEWTKTYGDAHRSNTDKAYSVIEAFDNGLIMAGEHKYVAFNNQSRFGPSNAALVKTDSAGVMLWTKTYGGGGFEYYAQSVIEHSTDNGIVIAGYTGNTTNSNYMLLKTDSLGLEQWTKTYGENDNAEAYSVIEHSIDQGFVLAGVTTRYGAGTCV
jgi:hypothetical protein